MPDGHDRIVIVGAGQAGAQLAVSLRDEGCDDEIVLLGGEPQLPYERPPLSKGFLRADEDLTDLLLHTMDFYRERAIDVRVDCQVTSIDPSQQLVLLADGEQLPYDRLVLATGATPRPLPFPRRRSL